MLYDFHSHILPDIDDGSQNVEQSIAMMNILRESGVGTVVATPHFYYNKTDLEHFLRGRDKAYNKLMAAISDDKTYPRILKGAEVLLTTDIPRMEGLEKLCIENTSYILIELPYTYWSDWVFRAVDEISMRGLKPIIAHIDRYSEKSKNIYRVFDLRCMIQLNVDSLVSRRTKKKSLKYIKYGEIQLLGSDTHDEKHRPPRFKEAMTLLNKKFGPDIERMFENNSLYVLNDEG